MRRAVTLTLATVCAFAMSGCAVGRFIQDDINATLGRSPEDRAVRADIAAAEVKTIGVNSYLWRAALDTLSFAPLAQVDSSGGVIVTDWYANPGTPNDRVKVTVNHTFRPVLASIFGNVSLSLKGEAEIRAEGS